MEMILEQARQVPVLDKAQVLVVGGGPSGIAAALAAARCGADTLLLERYGCFGGVITQVGVEAVAWYRHEGKVNEAGGILKEMEETALAMGASTKECQSDSQALDAEMFKYVCDQMLVKSGVRLLLDIYVVDVIKEDNKISGVITESKSGRQAILAERVIDCTGDGDVMHLSRAFYHKAPKEKLMSVTELFSCKGVDTQKFMTYVKRDLKPTYADWGGECWSQSTTGKEDEMFTPYLEKPFIVALKDGYVVIDVPNTSIGGTWSTVTP
ncbi:MAG: FAD-dependent oxidoreductase [Angelakisella sp.]|nr:FAD-dependent oxidoreductase [Angelakisella sp.]